MATIFHIVSVEVGMRQIETEYPNNKEIGMFYLLTQVLFNNDMEPAKQVEIMNGYIDAFYAKERETRLNI